MDEVGAMDENGQDPDEVSWNTMLWSEEQLREIRRRLSDRGITHYMDEGDLVMAITVEPTAERIVDDVLRK